MPPEKFDCPQCGAPANPSANKCEYCKAHLRVSGLAQLGGLERGPIDKYLAHYKGRLAASQDDASAHLAQGLCYLQLKLFPVALKSFQRAFEIAPDLADAYYYAALCIAKGRRPKLMSLSEVRQAEEYLDAARQLNSGDAKYDLFLAALKYDYYLANGLMVRPPTHDDLLSEARGKQSDAAELQSLFGALSVPDKRFSNALAA